MVSSLVCPSSLLAQRTCGRGLRHVAGGARCLVSRAELRSSSSAPSPSPSAPPSAPATPPTRAPQRTGKPSPPPPPPLLEWPAPRSFLEVAWSKATDTVADVVLLTRRFVWPQLPASALLTTTANGSLELRGERPVLLVLGSGWAAHALIKVVDTSAWSVVVVSPRNHFIFSPMLCSSAVGTVEFRSLLEPVRVSNPEVTYLEASCFSLDPLGKVATCVQAALQPDGSPGQPFAVPYAACFVSCGEQTATYNTPGVPEHTFQLKEVGDAVALRRRIGEVFELAALPSTTPEQRADLLHFIVVGGGPTGVEFAGTLSDFVREDLAKRFPLPVRSAARVTLLQSGGAILGQFAEKLQESALATLAAEGVEVRLRSRVARVDPGAVTLAGGEVLRCGLVVWSVGNSARPLTAALSAALPAQRAFAPDPSAPSVKLAVDPWLRVAGARDLLAAGDCARLHGCPLPATAQAAAQQGAYAARLLSRGYALGVGGLDKPPPHRPAAAAGAGAAPASAWPTAAWEVAPVFEFLGLGLLAYVGADSALTQVDAGLLQLQLSGPFAFLLWRSVYITKQVSLRNRVLILFDWLKTRLFGRDLSLF